MVKYENHCVCCEKPCIHGACHHYKVKVCYCDNCREPAAYEYDGKHYCRDCLEEELDIEFRALSIQEKIKALVLEDEITEV